MTQERDPEREVLDALEGLGLPYERLSCDPDAADTAAFCARYGYPRENSLNTILVASKKEPKKHAVCVIRSSTLLDVNQSVRRLMEVPRLSFASAEETVELTGMRVGGVTPFSLPAGVAVYVDEAVMGLEYVILGGGGRSSKLKVSPDVLRRIPGVRIVPGLARERPA